MASVSPCFFIVDIMKKLGLQRATAVLMLLWGVLITSLGFYTEPQGEVSSSVCWILGQSLIYAGSVFGLKNYVDVKLGNHEEH